MGTRFSLLLSLTVLGVSACQTTTAVYDKSTFSSRPSINSYSNSDEFVRDSIIYLMPRVCVFHQTSDGVQVTENKRPDKFSFYNIVENKLKDGWYIGTLDISNAFYGELSVYFNKNTGDYSCTGRRTKQTNTGVQFVTGRYLDLASLSPVGKSSPTKARRGSGMNYYTDEVVCKFAVYTHGNTPKWDSNRYVPEARQRGLTIADCLKYVAIKTPSSKQPSPTTSVVTREAPPSTKKPLGGSKSRMPESLTSSPKVRPIAMEWEGYNDLIAGKVELNQNKDGGTISLLLPNNEGRCTGNYSFGSKTEGTWALACTNGMAATGTFEAFGANRGSAGKGTDTKGRKVKYTIGAG